MSSAFVELLLAGRGEGGVPLLNRKNIPDALELFHADVDRQLAAYGALSAEEQKKALVFAPLEDTVELKSAAWGEGDQVVMTADQVKEAAAKRARAMQKAMRWLCRKLCKMLPGDRAAWVRNPGNWGWRASWWRRRPT